MINSLDSLFDDARDGASREGMGRGIRALMCDAGTIVPICCSTRGMETTYEASIAYLSLRTIAPAYWTYATAFLILVWPCLRYGAREGHAIKTGFDSLAFQNL